MRLDKWMAQSIRRLGVIGMFEQIELHQRDLLRILGYHRVGYPDLDRRLFDPSLLSATPEKFEEQMAFLRCHYHIIRLEDLITAISTGEHLPPRSVMVTFDDGYHDFLDFAWPVLKKYQIPAVLFVPTGQVYNPSIGFWWDRLYHAIYTTQYQEFHLPGVGDWKLQDDSQRWVAFEALKRQVQGVDYCDGVALVERILEALAVEDISFSDAFLNWNEIRQMHADGLYIAAHTRTHCLLSRITCEEAEQEIKGSQLDIERELAQTWPVFAYPSGHLADICPSLIETLKRCCFIAAMTTVEGHNHLKSTNPFYLRRVSITAHLSITEFQTVLTHAYEVYSFLVKPRQAIKGYYLDALKKLP